MNTFLQKHRSSVTGYLSGFDRLVLRGSLRALYGRPVMEQYLRCRNVLMKDFGKHVHAVTGQLKQATELMAETSDRPILYLPSTQISKESKAREVMEQDGIQEGLICILSCVEPCQTFDVYRNRETRTLDLVSRMRKCLHYYHYWIDPEIGFMHGRIQTWFPFQIQICLNGREWLSRSLDREGIAYQKSENCFPWIEDTDRAQSLMDDQLKTDWPGLLNGLAHRLNPIHDEIFHGFSMRYYWTVHESEWATDIMFRCTDDLAALYRRLVHHGMSTFNSHDVMRFLGRKVLASGKVRKHFKGEVVSDLRERPEGVRIRHRVKRNWIKMYDKQGSILRVETVINDPRDFRSYRPKEGGRKEEKQWMIMRRGVADLHRRAQVSQAANDRYLEMLSDVDADTSLGERIGQLCHHVMWKGKRFRGLNPFGKDDSLLAVILHGEYMVNGFRNRDIREKLFGVTDDFLQINRLSGRVTRLIRLLRAHHLIRKITSTKRYLPTRRGRKFLVALASAKNASSQKLTELAA
jgi:hypothetical protein